MTTTADKTRKRWTLVAMILASGVVFLDGTIVSIALPAIDRELKAGLSGLQWIVDGYLLTLSAFLILGGSLGDQYGRKLMMLIGLVGFGITSAICGFAPATEWLAIARLLQGVAGAFLVPGSLAIITSVFTDDEERGSAIGTWSGWGGMSTIIGPSVGGWIVDNLSWRWVFFINVPLIAITIWLLLQHVPETEKSSEGKPHDWAGAVLAVLGLGGTIYGLIEGPVLGWGSPTILLGIIGGVMALGLFIAVEARSANPMMPLWLFRSRNFSGTNLATFGIYFGLYGVSFFLTLYLQQVVKFSAFLAGASMLPSSLIMLVFSPRIGRLAGRYGARLFMTFGAFLYAGGILLLLRLSPTADLWFDLMPAVLVMAFGLGLIVAPLTGAIMGSVPAQNSGTASAINNVVSRVAALLAIAGLGIVVALTFSSSATDRAKTLPPNDAATLQNFTNNPSDALSLPNPSPQLSAAINAAYTDAFRWVIIVCVIMVVAGGLVAAATIRKTNQPK